MKKIEEVLLSGFIGSCREQAPPVARSSPSVAGRTSRAASHQQWGTEPTEFSASGPAPSSIEPTRLTPGAAESSPIGPRKLWHLLVADLLPRRVLMSTQLQDESSTTGTLSFRTQGSQVAASGFIR